MKRRFAIGILFLCLVVCLSAPVWAGGDAVMDLDNHTATFTGSWGLSGLGTGSGPFFYGDTISWAACNGNDTPAGAVTSEATWRSDSVGLQQMIKGNYAVYVRATSDPNRTDSARFRIYSSSRAVLPGPPPWTDTLVGSCTINQKVRGGEWVYCDTVPLDAPTGTVGVQYAAAVKVGNNCEAGKYVIADAVRFVRQSWDHNDVVDMPGGQSSSNLQFGIAGMPISTDCNAMTNLTSVTLIPPAGHGFIMVNAVGHYDLNSTNNWVELCIAESSGGSTCDSHPHYFETASTSGHQGEGDFAISHLYAITLPGSRTFYLKACRLSGATGDIYLDNLAGLYIPAVY